MAKIRNGGFEKPVIDTGPGFQTFSVGENLSGWKVIKGTVDIFDTTRGETGEGDQSLDLNGVDAGTIVGKIKTVIGQSYTVSFLFAGNPENPAVTLHEMTAKAGGTAATFVADTSLPFAWGLRSFSFTATDTRTKLSFSGDPTNGFNGPLIDAVTIAETAPAIASAATDWAL